MQVAAALAAFMSLGGVMKKQFLVERRPLIIVAFTALVSASTACVFTAPAETPIAIQGPAGAPAA
jgi:hypothetical protein